LVIALCNTKRILPKLFFAVKPFVNK
jgi:hypothetical protein